MHKLLRGIGRWQLRAAAVGCIALVVTFVAALLGNESTALLGLSMIGAALLVLVLSTARLMNGRTSQIKAALARIESQPKIELEKVVAVVQEEVSVVDTPPTKVVIPRVGPEYEFAGRIHALGSHLETFALRSQSREIRQIFARASTHGEHSYEEIVRILAVIDMKMASKSMLDASKSWNETYLLSLARLAANQRSSERDIEDAARIFAFVEEYFGTGRLGRTDRLLYLEILDDLGRAKDLRLSIKRFGTRNNFPRQAALLRLNSIKLHDSVSSAAWLGVLNAEYAMEKLAPVEFDIQGGDHWLDRLRPSSHEVVESGPLVSVLVPTYNGGELLRTAIFSLLAQTWRNLEIIVIDDCSDESSVDILNDLGQLPRVTVLRQDENLGAYCARNRGLTVAAGELITVHDDDDWSHPQKIELQVRHLLENPHVVANMSHHARCTEDLKILRINNNPQFTQPNFSSLLARKSVFQTLGSWDTVNRGADAEFRDRVVAHYGEAIPVVGSVALSFTRTRDGSLTAGEMARGYVDSSRLMYLASYKRWQNIAAQSKDLSMPQDALSRPFQVPASMEAGMRGKHLGRFDVVFATDFRFPGGTTSLTLQEIEVARKNGLRVGVIQLASPLNKPSAPISEGLFRLFEQGIECLGLRDQAEIEMMVIRHPSVANYLDGASSNLDVARCVLIVNNPPVLRGGSGMVFDLETCLHNLDRVFGVRTTLVAESGVTRRLSRGLTASSRMSPRIWPGIVRTGPAIDAAIPNGQVIVGRHSRDHELKWPSDLKDFAAAYHHADDNIKTTFLGGAACLEKKLGKASVEGITVHGYGALAVETYLDSIHFWVYFHDNKLHESFGMATAEAMAAGKVVILPPYMEATFGDGALYAKPESVRAIIREYTENVELYRAQSRRARAKVESDFSEQALLDRIQYFKTPLDTAVPV